MKNIIELKLVHTFCTLLVIDFSNRKHLVFAEKQFFLFIICRFTNELEVLGTGIKKGKHLQYHHAKHI